MSLYQRALLQGIAKIFTLPRLSVPLMVTLGFTLGAVLCVLAVISVLQLKPLPGVSKEANLYSLSIEMALSEQLKVPMMDLRRFAYFKKHFAKYGIWSVFNQRDEQLNINDQNLAITEFTASRRILDVLGLPLIKGENPDIDEVAGKIWISNSLWRTAYSGREDILGKTLSYKSKTYQISGILPDFTAVDSEKIVVLQQIWLISNENAQFKKAEEGKLNGSYEKILLRKTTNNLPTTHQLLDWNTQYTDEQIASEELKDIFKVRKKQLISNFIVTT